MFDLFFGFQPSSIINSASPKEHADYSKDVDFLVIKTEGGNKKVPHTTTNDQISCEELCSLVLRSQPTFFKLPPDMSFSNFYFIGANGLPKADATSVIPVSKSARANYFRKRRISVDRTFILMDRLVENPMLRVV